MPEEFNITIDPNRSPLDAVNLAASRDLLPSALSSREQRVAFTEAMRESSVFSARTTNAFYLQKVREVVNQVLSGDMDLPLARLVLKQTLAALGYTPEGGFPEDSEGLIPPAVAGTLEDLSSNRRLNLMLDTQIALNRGRGQRDRGLIPARMRAFPAYELVRIGSREVPRDWVERWLEIGGVLYEGRMIAMKDDPFWAELGSSEYFNDALDVSYPPFAFNSGKGWAAVPLAEVRRLGVVVRDGDDIFTVDDVIDNRTEVDVTVPMPKPSLKGLKDGFLERMKDALKKHDEIYGEEDMSIDAIVQRNLERNGEDGD